MAIIESIGYSHPSRVGTQIDRFSITKSEAGSRLLLMLRRALVQNEQITLEEKMALHEALLDAGIRLDTLKANAVALSTQLADYPLYMGGHLVEEFIKSIYYAGSAPKRPRKSRG